MQLYKEYDSHDGENLSRISLQTSFVKTDVLTLLKLDAVFGGDVINGNSEFAERNLTEILFKIEQ